MTNAQKLKVIENIRNMDNESLHKHLDLISVSDGSPEDKDFIIEAIHSKLNNEQLRHLAIVPEVELRHGKL